MALRTQPSWVCLTVVCLLGSAVADAQQPRSAYLGPCALAASKDGKTLVVANADARQVAWVELPAGKVTRRVSVPSEPTGIALTPDGTKLVVTCAAPKSTVVVLDAVSAQRLATFPAGHTAIGPAMSPDGKRLYVCNRFDNNVSVIDLAAGKEVARVDAVREPVAAAVAPDGKMVFVANHLPDEPADAYPLAAVVTTIDVQTNKTARIALAHGSHSVRGLCVSPDGKHVYVTHLLSSFELIPMRLDMGWMSSNVISVIDTQQKKVVKTVALDELYQGSANPWGVACTNDGKWICVANAGTHEMTAVSAAAIMGTLDHIFTAPTVEAIPDVSGQDRGLRRTALSGRGPRGVVVVGTKVVIAEYFSDTLAVVDLQAPMDDPAETISLGPEPRLTVQRRGELLFNDATICYQHWQSCASCHPDGRTDVLNWDLMNDGVGNPKNTKSMLLAYKTPPSMAEGVRPNAEAATRSGMENILFNTRPEDEYVAIDEYLKSLTPVPSPHLIDGRLGPAAQRGKKLFESDAVGCSKCHPAPLYTDLKMHNVHSQAISDSADRFDTPTLVEVWRTAPYLHDGRYKTIKELIVKGKHGKTRGNVDKLGQPEIDDLVEFVLSL